MEEIPRFKQFVQSCARVLNDDALMKLIKKRYQEANPHYVHSSEFEQLLVTTEKNILANPRHKFVYFKTLAGELKAYKNRNVPKHLEKYHQKRKLPDEEKTSPESNAEPASKKHISEVNRASEAHLEDKVNAQNGDAAKVERSATQKVDNANSNSCETREKVNVDNSNSCETGESTSDDVEVVGTCSAQRVSLAKSRLDRVNHLHSVIAELSSNTQGSNQQKLTNENVLVTKQYTQGAANRVRTSNDLAQAARLNNVVDPSGRAAGSIVKFRHNKNISHRPCSTVAHIDLTRDSPVATGGSRLTARTHDPSADLPNLISKCVENAFSKDERGSGILPNLIPSSVEEKEEDSDSDIEIVSAIPAPSNTDTQVIPTTVTSKTAWRQSSSKPSGTTVTSVPETATSSSLEKSDSLELIAVDSQEKSDNNLRDDNSSPSMSLQQRIVCALPVANSDPVLVTENISQGEETAGPSNEDSEGPEMAVNEDKEVSRSKIENELKTPKSKASAKQLQRLEALLEKTSKAIQKLEERELSMDDLDSEDSAYVMEERLKKRFVKIWEKLCDIKGRKPTTGRHKEQKFKYSGTRYPEVNRKVEKLLNKKQIFPDYPDILKLVKKTNLLSGIGLTHSHVESLARDIFTEVGNTLQDRRRKDFVENIDSHLPSKYQERNDPAWYDKELKRKLDTHKQEAKTKMNEVLNKFSDKQLKIRDGEDAESDHKEEENDDDNSNHKGSESDGDDDDGDDDVVGENVEDELENLLSRETVVMVTGEFSEEPTPTDLAAIPEESTTPSERVVRLDSDDTVSTTEGAQMDTKHASPSKPTLDKLESSKVGIEKQKHSKKAASPILAEDDCAISSSNLPATDDSNSVIVLSDSE